MAILTAPTHIAVPPAANPLQYFRPRRRLADVVTALRAALRWTPSTPTREPRIHRPGREDFLERAVMARAMDRL